MAITSLKWFNLSLLSLAQLLAMSLWFSASAVLPQITNEWHLSSGQQSWITMAVQIGFVVGGIISAFFNLADRISPNKLIGFSSLSGALFNVIISAGHIGIETAIFFRFLTGLTLAGVYPPGMKLIASWCDTDRGLGIGILIGALTIGSASPHLVNSLVAIPGQSHFLPWRVVLGLSSIFAVVAALLCYFFVKAGPLVNEKSPFNWRYLIQSFSDRGVRLANFGYFGHMWELYAMWAWAPIFILSSFEKANLSVQMARFWGFLVIAVGAVGSVVAGISADRIGRTTVTVIAMIISGLCALSVGFFFGNPVLLIICCLIWGLAIVADSGQFSAAVSELADSKYIGTALTMQTAVGFLLTLVTIRLVPIAVKWVGWDSVFIMLAVGPVFGIWSMLRLRRIPQATKMASGNR